jgi:hypothetical protein
MQAVCCVVRRRPVLLMLCALSVPQRASAIEAELRAAKERVDLAQVRICTCPLDRIEACLQQVGMLLAPACHPGAIQVDLAVQL